MFQFRAFPSYGYFIYRTITGYCPVVFPHSEISGSQLICSSPKLFAACHVLHRLLMPRHSPCALYSLTFVGRDCTPLRPPHMAGIRSVPSLPPLRIKDFALIRAGGRGNGSGRFVSSFPTAMNVHSFRFSNYAGSTEVVLQNCICYPILFHN